MPRSKRHPRKSRRPRRARPSSGSPAVLAPGGVRAGGALEGVPEGPLGGFLDHPEPLFVTGPVDPRDLIRGC